MFDPQTRQLLTIGVQLAATVITGSGAKDMARDLFVRLLDDALADGAPGAALARAVDYMAQLGAQHRRATE